MKLTITRVLALGAISFAAGSLLTLKLATPAHVEAQSNSVYELRVYHAMPGKLGDIVKRFKDDTRRVFNKHGIESVGYWVPQDSPAKENTLIYIVKHPNREAGDKNWKAFTSDPEWQEISKRTQANGRLVEKIDSTFMDPTEYSALK